MQLSLEEQQHLLLVLIEHVAAIEDKLGLHNHRSDQASVVHRLSEMVVKDKALMRKLRSSLVNRP